MITPSASAAEPSVMPTRQPSPSRVTLATRCPSRMAPAGSREARARVSSSIPSANVTKRDQRAPLAPFASSRARPPAPPPRPPQPEDETPLAALDLEEARHGGGQRKHVRIGSIDAGNQRLRHPLERFAPQPARDESAQALVRITPARQHKVHGHP